MAKEVENNCWICKAPADSAEHRLKKTDIVRAFGSGPYSGLGAPIHTKGSVSKIIQGPGSSSLKYDKSLCHACNTSGTQKFDRAYDRLISWVYANEDAVLRRRFTNF